MHSSPLHDAVRTGTRRRRALIAGAWTFLCLLISGCEATSRESTTSTDPASPCSGRPVRLAVAASLRDIAQILVADLEAATPPTEIEISFGASSALARQLELGAPIDILVSADESLVHSLAEAGHIEPISVRSIASGRLVLATREGSAFETMGLGAIRSPSLKRLGLPARVVPLGRYGHAWLEREGLIDALSGKIVATENARANSSALEQGHIDLAILYETDLRSKPALRAIYRPSPDDYPPIRYVAARSSGSPACPEIDRVLASWQSERTRTLLSSAGFEPPPLSARFESMSDPEHS